MLSKLITLLIVLGSTTLAHAALSSDSKCRAAEGKIQCVSNYGFSCRCEQTFLIRLNNGQQYTQRYQGFAQGYAGSGTWWRFWDESNCHGAKGELKANSEARLLPVCQ